MDSYRFLDELVSASDTGVYLVDVERFATNITRFRDAFRAHYPDTTVAYSYKTNYLPAFCRRADELGCLAEVVSAMELELTERLDVPGERVLFNGPAKSPAAERRALDAGIRVHVDSLDEVATIERLHAGAKKRRPWRVVMRCHPGLEGLGDSRFGMDVERGDLDRAIGRIRALEDVDIVGLHAHICPPRRSAEVYGRLARYLVEVAGSHLTVEEFATLNLGGGFYSPMPESMASQWSHAIPTFEEYGEAVGQALGDALGAGKRPELILEPGISVTADTIDFACRVVATKDVGGQQVAVTSGSVYDVKPSKASNNQPLEVVSATSSDSGGEGADWLITGFTCMEDDVMYRGWSGPLEVGDICVFGNVGAYSNVLRPPFIKPAAPMVVVDRESATAGETVRRAETFEDVFGAYAL